MAVEGASDVVRPGADVGPADPLHRATDPRFRAVAAPPGALLPVRRNAAHTQLCRCADLRHLPCCSGPLYHLVDDNPFAAIPSLHGGYSFLVFLFIATLVWDTRWRWTAAVAFLYPVLQSFAAVYTGNHYVIDLLIGFVYATAALFGVRWFWRRMGWPE